MPRAKLLPDDRASASGSAGLTRAEFDSLAIELRELRRMHAQRFADRLRDARASGSPGDNEDVLAVHEEVSADAARVARLEELLRSAPIVVDREFDGCVSLGCTVRVVDDEGRAAEYVVIGRRSEGSARHEVSAGSPVGRALLGARPVSSCAWSFPTGAIARSGSST
jgi:transcription elongation factor GreA